MSMNKIYFKQLLASALFCVLAISVNAQNKQKVTGRVLDDNGQPVAGATVVVDGTTNGTTTDFDGNYTITADSDATLKVVFIGYDDVLVPVNGQSIVNFTLKDSFTELDELVVVGYGVQKKSVVSAAIAKVSADDLSATAPVRMDNALKGLAAGVNVTSASGQPGEAARIRVRGTGTINNSDPLYIVDGMPIEGGLDYLNPNDIQSIEVLKDAASGAVYGARAANGVILVTTKTGKEGATRFNYDFSYGWQSPWKKRDVLNATEYAIMINEGYTNAGAGPKYDDPYQYGEGTDWQKEVFNENAPMLSHQLSVSGGNKKVSYLISGGFFKQEGIVGGNWDRSNYQRFTFRSNTAVDLFDVSEERSWLNNAKFTSNISYANIKSTGISTNSAYGSPLGSALALSPILTVYEPNKEAEQAQIDKYADNKEYLPMYDPHSGKMFTIAGADYNEMVNPIASLSLPASWGWSHKIVSNFGAEIQLFDGLRFRSSFGTDLSFWGSDSHVVKYYLTTNNKATKTSVFQSSDNGFVWQLENVLMYNKSIDKHTFDVLLGQSAKQSSGKYLNARRYGMIDETGARPYLDYTNGTWKISHTEQDKTETTIDTGILEAEASGAKNPKASLASLFARANYNYDERYIAQFTVRRDGSSRFGSNNHYAIFPSFSLAWNPTNESFLESRPEWFSSAKVRYSWGKNGNENIGNFRYTVLTSGSNNYILGNAQTVTQGVKASGLANPDLKWEESNQSNIGLDLAFFSNSLTMTLDYFVKNTEGMLMEMNIPSYVGEAKPIGNVGKMKNSGLELELGYKWSAGSDWKFAFNGNISYLKNELVEYGNESGWANLDSFQGVGTITRAENGQPFPYFYGYKTAGIFQNMAEVQSYVNKDGQMIMPDAVPGDVRFVDVNKDGVFNDDDRTKIGKGTPDFTFGMNFNASWKIIDFSMMWQGTAGNDVFNATRRTDISASNMDTWMLGRWTGEGTSNKIPRFVIGDKVNWQSSDLYIEDGSYIRLKNIQLGISLPENIIKHVFMNRCRFYVAAENLLTFTKYRGFDPEISSGATSLGVDYGVYPQARVFTVGANIAF